MRARSCSLPTSKYEQGFTLVELMVALTLGLGLMALLVGTIEKISRASRESADAAEVIERGYFLMDSIDAWVAETSPMVITQRPLENLTWVGASEEAVVSVASVEVTRFSDAMRASSVTIPSSRLSTPDIGPIDACQTPAVAPLPLDTAGVVALDAEALACIPQRYLETSAPALLLERRLACRGDCNAAGFYIIPVICFGDYEMHQYQPSWLEASSDRSECFANGSAVSVDRSLIYVRDYSWRVGDGIRAVMIRELAEEQEARWLRSSMLAHDIDDWRIECLQDCDSWFDSTQATVLASAIDLSFTVNSASFSVEVQRVLASQHSKDRNDGRSMHELSSF